jgi:hypothetical protein
MGQWDTVLKGGGRLTITGRNKVESNGTMGPCFARRWRLKELDVVAHRVMGQWDTVLKWDID